jgi:hypothetical protein
MEHVLMQIAVNKHGYTVSAGGAHFSFDIENKLSCAVRIEELIKALSQSLASEIIEKYNQIKNEENG